MHYLAKLLVKGETVEDALCQAETDANALVEQGYYDWFDFNGRWGKSDAHPIDSEEGKKLIEEGMRFNRQQFDEALSGIRYMLDNFSDEEIYNEKFPSYKELEGKLPEGVYSLSRWQFTKAAGKSPSGSIYAMSGDLWGERVYSDRELESILTDNKENLWVVPVDVHY